MSVGVVAAIVLITGIALAAAGVISGTGQPSFVTRSGDRLTLNGQAFRFSGANVYWGGLDENGRTGTNYPTGFRVRSALATAADMGETVVRCQTCGISTGGPDSVEPKLGQFNQTALAHIDYFIAQAQRDGLRVVIPLTGDYDYYLGGYHNFTDWLGLSPSGGCPSAACASAFYSNPKAVAAFEQYISVLLNHVNVYTGVANKDNPAIMSWETGNELPLGTGGPAEFTKWTGTISAYLKSLAPRQLVTDGALVPDPGDLRLPDVDIQAPHFYPASTAVLRADVRRTAASGQVTVVGEYPWNSPGLNQFLRFIQATPGVSGDLYWDLLPQDDDFGLVQHDDGYQLHFPQGGAVTGADPGGPAAPPPTVAPAITELRAHAYAMSGQTAPAWPVPAAPAITNVEHVTGSASGSGATGATGPESATGGSAGIGSAGSAGSGGSAGNLVEWRGAPGAASYVVRRSASGPGGPWTTVCRGCQDTSAGPFLDRGAGDGPALWYQVAAVSAGGARGPWSAAFQVTAGTLDDAVDDHVGSGDLVLRMTGLSSAEVVAPGIPQVSVFLSVNGTGWRPVPPVDVQVSGGPVGTNQGGGGRPGGGAGGGAASTPYVFTVDGAQRLDPGAAYVRVRWGTPVSSAGGSSAADPGTGDARIAEIRVTGARS